MPIYRIKIETEERRRSVFSSLGDQDTDAPRAGRRLTSRQRRWRIARGAPAVVLVKAEFDIESRSWWATADIDERHALATGAPTLDELLTRIPIVIRDLLTEARA